MTPDQIIIAALSVAGILACVGWHLANREVSALTADCDRLQAELTRLTDRDEKGRFVRREK